MNNTGLSLFQSLILKGYSEKKTSFSEAFPNLESLKSQLKKEPCSHQGLGLHL